MTEAPVGFNLHLPDVGFGGGLALWGFRACAIGASHCRLTLAAFDQVFGAEGGLALSAMNSYTDKVGRLSARKIQLEPPCSRGTTLDELYIVAAFAAVQRCDLNAASTYLQELLGRPVAMSITEHTGEIAKMFNRLGLLIETPSADPIKQAEGCGKLRVVGGRDHVPVARGRGSRATPTSELTQAKRLH